MHWHIQSEWAFVLTGSCRIAAVDQEGRNFLEDVKAGDLWYFPAGIPHHIQAHDEGVEFLLVFDDGCYSEDATFQLTDFFSHVPKEVIGKNFGWTMQQMANFPPESERYIFRGRARRRWPRTGSSAPPATCPGRSSTACSPRRRRSSRAAAYASPAPSNFAAAITTTVAMVEIEPGAMRNCTGTPTARRCST
ncbi:cupin domain-containing protein [Micromonospora sp. BRA006-A]|nr:cupin domain-containing protein [Micromonospora sp. BRA006-A]